MSSRFRIRFPGCRSAVVWFLSVKYGVPQSTLTVPTRRLRVETDIHLCSVYKYTYTAITMRLHRQTTNQFKTRHNMLIVFSAISVSQPSNIITYIYPASIPITLGWFYIVILSYLVVRFSTLVAPPN